MTVVSEDATADLYRRIAELERRLETALIERDAAIERQTANALVNFHLQSELRATAERQNAGAEILRTIANTKGDAENALQRIGETTAHFFNAAGVTIRIAEGDEWVQAIRVGSGSQLTGGQPAAQLTTRGANLPATVYRDNRQIHIPDLDNIDPSMADWPATAARAAGIRTICGTPLRRDGKAIGAMIVYRDRLAAFTDEELALQQTFADQAVIAIENARLFNQARQALDRQEAGAEILRTIAAAPNDAEQSLQQVVETTARLFGASSVRIRLVKDGEWGRTFQVGRSSEAVRSTVPDAKAPIGGRNLPGTVVAENRQIHIPDLDHIPLEMADWPGLPPARAAGARTVSGTPLRREGKAIGALVIHRDHLQPFSEAELALQQSFADQAAIAIENARLFNETQEALERQTATADILKVIASSPSDVQPVFDAIAASANRLMHAHATTVWRSVEGMIRLAAFTPVNPIADETLRSRSSFPTSSSMYWHLIRDGNPAQFADTEDVSPSTGDRMRELGRARGFRSLLVVPLMSEGVAIGTINVTRATPGPFAEGDVQLLRTFADQAVIAIENTRLFNETKEALERQTATADILKVIASSPSDTTPVFEAIASSANRLLAGFSAAVFRLSDRTVHLAAFTPTNPAADEALKADFPRPVDSFEPIRLTRPGEPFPIPDTEKLPYAPIREIARLHGFRSMLFVPLMNGGLPIGVISVTRTEPGAFAPHHVQLLRTFADQAVIAIENTRLFNETQEALERQTATSDILRVIAGSPSNVHPVFEAIVNSAARLFEPCSATITTLRGDQLHWEATASRIPGFDVSSAKATYPIAFDPNRSLSARTILERRIVEIPDVMAPDTPELTRKAAAAGGFQSVIFVPLINQDNGIGTIILTHPEAGFRLSEKQLSLVQTFADQAVIAIENTRLFNETQEALERQTATADILKVIASSPSDVQPVFDAIVTSAKTLLSGFSSTVYRFIEGHAWLEAFTPTTAEADEILRSNFPLPVSRFAPFEIAQAGEVTQIPDTENLTGEILDIARARGFRSMLFAPLMNQATAIGLIAVTRASTGTFADHHVQLLKTFADQAVIAIENTRLFNEVQARTNDLTESLQQQTATADVLKVISRSAFDLQTVLETLIRSAVELSGAGRGAMFLRDGELFRYRAASHANQYPDWIEFLQHNPQRAGRHSAIARAIASAQTVSVPDVLADPEIKLPATTLANIRAAMAVPLLRDGKVEGMMALSRPTPGPFTDRQIELVQTFADQAVIAIENARLFDEVQAKTRDLSESLQQQTATADVLKVISRSAFDLQAVLDTLVESAARLCEADHGIIVRPRDGQHRVAASWGLPPEIRAYLESRQFQAGENSAAGRALLEARVIRVDDVLDSPDYVLAGDPNPARTRLAVPLLRQGKPIGVFVLTRREARPFSEKQIELVQTFADQAVIAIENVRLFDEVQSRTRELSKSLDDLRTAQDRLIQTEKLASLGQLTAGIAHEIKNPLNFVNNFAALSAELTDELNETLKPAALDESLRAEVDELTSTLKDNLGKVVQHGKRADSIVKNMLLHSREGSGEHRPTDINALVDESLNLAYHGARAEKPHFNVTLKRNFDPGAGMIEVFPQEITRVFLNLISNGFYAVSKRKADHVDASFEPVVTATTIGRTDHVEIRIRDNGIGIPADVKEKMFNPFFTTKPAGEGTGLGLSMSHDIIVKQHGGTIEVDTLPGAFTEFKIILPRTSNLSNQSRGQT